VPDEDHAAGMAGHARPAGRNRVDLQFEDRTGQ
jgi:hypothetical protein